MSDGPYARLYLSLVDDEKFADIYDDDHHFAAWCRLLMEAEAAYPASAAIPVGTRRASLEALEGAGLIHLQSKTRYRIHGLDRERSERSDKARASVAHRIDRSTTVERPYIDRPTSQAEQSKAEQSTAAAGASDDPVVHYANLMAGFPTVKAMGWIDDLTSTYGDDAVIRALALARQGGTNGVIGRAQDILRAEARELSKREKDAEAVKVQARRVDGMQSRRLEWFRNTGKWDSAWGDPPEAA